MTSVFKFYTLLTQERIFKVLLPGQFKFGHAQRLVDCVEILRHGEVKFFSKPASIQLNTVIQIVDEKTLKCSSKRR